MSVISKVRGTALAAGAVTLRSVLWLYRIALDARSTRGSTRHATADESAGEAVFTFRTERSPVYFPGWGRAAQLVVHLDRGERALPVQLSWRGQDGSEAAISFASSMAGFHGSYRAPDGTLSEYRGSLEGRSVFPGGTGANTVLRFSTQEGWNGTWHASGGLRLSVDDGGGSPLERLTWRDGAGNSGSVSLRSEQGRPDTAAEVSGLVRTVRASDEYTAGREIAENVLAADWSKWLGHQDGGSYLRFTLAEPVTVRYYLLCSGNDAQDRDPVDWVLRGSHDNQRWVDLDARTGQVFGRRCHTRGFALADGKAAPYLYYRLDIHRNAGSPHTQLCQVRFFDTAPTPAGDGFIGYYQRAGEDPVGYRGEPETVAATRRT